MKNLSFSEFLILISFLLSVFIAIFAVEYHSHPELFNDSNDFKSEFVFNNSVNITILDAKSYYHNNRNTRQSYYIYTDKGRLKVNKKGVFSHNSDLYHEIRMEHIGKKCKGEVSKGFISSQWEIHSISCL